MAKLSTTHLYYFLGIVLLLLTSFLIEKSLSAQMKEVQDISLMAECMPATQFSAPSMITVDFNFSSEDGNFLPSAKALIIGGPMEMPGSGHVISTIWHPSEKANAIAFLSGPRMKYWAPCSPNAQANGNVSLIAYKSGENGTTKVYYQSKSNKKLNFTNLAELPSGDSTNAVVLTKSHIDPKTAEAVFGEGTKADYTLAIQMDMSPGASETGKAKIMVGVQND